MEVFAEVTSMEALVEARVEAFVEITALGAFVEATFMESSVNLVEASTKAFV